MSKHFVTFSAVVLVVVVLVAGAVDGVPTLQGDRVSIEIPSTQIVSVGGDILRIETASGAVYHLDGDPHGPTAANTWKRRARAVGLKL